MSLQGRRVVVSRAPHQAGKLADLLRARAAEPLLFPCIDIAPPEDTTLLDNALNDIAQFDWLVLTSANTVVALQRRLEHPTLTLAPLKVAAVGRKTARSAEQRLGVTVDVVPDEQVAEGLAAAIPDVCGKRVLLPQSSIARDVLGDLLQNAGAMVTKVDAYRTVTGSGGVSVDAVLSADAVTFTSPSTVRGFVERCGTVLDLPAVCIGPITGGAARDLGFPQIVEPEHDYSLGGMLTVLESVFGEEAVHDDTKR